MTEQAPRGKTRVQRSAPTLAGGYILNVFKRLVDVRLWVNLLTLFLNRRRRIVLWIVLISLLGFCGFHFQQLRDNNSILTMLDRADEEYRYFLDDYIPEFGSGDDNTIIILFETPDALSSTTIERTRTIQRALEAIEIPFEMRPGEPTSDVHYGTADWSWNAEEGPATLISCLSHTSEYEISPGQCLRRFLFPVDIVVRRIKGSDSWFITRSTQAEISASDASLVPVECDQNVQRCTLKLVEATLSHADVLATMPGDSDAAKHANLQHLLRMPDNPDLAFFSLENHLLGGPTRNGDKAVYTIVALTVRLASLRDRDDIRSVALTWIEDCLAEHAEGGIEYHVLGAGAILATNANEIATTHVTLEPLAIIVAFVITAIATGGYLRLFLAAMFTVLASVFVTMGTLSLFGGSYNWVIVILPTIVVVTSVSDSIHLVRRYTERYPRFFAVEPAYRETLFTLMRPCFFTSLTTGLGLASIYLFAKAKSFSEFGLYGTLGVASAFIFSLIMFTLFVSPLKASASPPDHSRHTYAREAREGALIRAIVTWRKPIVIGTVLLMAWGAICAVLWVKIDFDYRTWYKKGTQITVAQDLVDSRMSGSNFFPIIVQSEERSDEACATIPGVSRDVAPERVCLTDAQVAALWDIRDKLLPGRGSWGSVQIPGEPTRWTDASSSILDLAFASRGQSAAEIMNQLQCYLDGGSLSLGGAGCELGSPTDTNPQRAHLFRDLVGAYFNLSAEDSTLRGRKTQVRVLSRQGNGADFQSYAQSIQHDLDTTTCTTASNCDATVTGYSYVCTKFLSETLVEMAWSFGFAFLLVVVVMLFLLRSHVWLALMSLVPNIIPLFLLPLGMVAWDIPLHFETMMIAAVAIGLVVDDTIQFASALRRGFIDLDGRPPGEAETLDRAERFRRVVTEALASTGSAIFWTSSSLFAGFILFLFSDFQMTADVGALLCTAIVIALVSDLVVFPALLMWLADSKALMNRLLRS